MATPDDLDAILRFIWDELTGAASPGESLFRHANLATISAEGAPQARTIVLRHADRDAREIGFHTDRRSAKVSELAACPKVALTAYDRPRGLQIRLWGSASVHCGDGRARAAWDALYPPLRAPYRTAASPGVTIEGPSSPGAGAPNGPEHGYENFANVLVRVETVELLRLDPDGHRRARYGWAGTWIGRWLAP